MNKVKYIVNCDNEEVQRAWSLYKEFSEILNEKLEPEEPVCHFWLRKPDEIDDDENVCILSTVRAVLNGVSHIDLRKNICIYAFEHAFGKNKECSGLVCWAVQENSDIEKDILNRLVYAIRASYTETMQAGFDVFIKKG